MLNLSNFAERLKELIIDNNVDTDMLIDIAKVNRTSVNRYLSGKCFPSVSVLVTIADYFKCTLDFLLGKVEDNHSTQFKKCPPFNKRLEYLLDYFHITKYKLCKEGRITESTLYYWLNGKHSPRICDIEKLAKYFDRSMDFIIGREN